MMWMLLLSSNSWKRTCQCKQLKLCKTKPMVELALEIMQEQVVMRPITLVWVDQLRNLNLEELTASNSSA